MPARRDPGLQAARQTVLREVASLSPNRQALDAAVDTLVAGQVPFRESLLGGELSQVVLVAAASRRLTAEAPLAGGPWQVVYTRGPLLWKQWTAPGKLAGSNNKVCVPRGAGAVSDKYYSQPSLQAGLPSSVLQASQAFEPRDRTVLNQGEIAGERFFVTAGGTYEPLDDSPRCPKRIKASIEQGTLHLLQWTLPLPIKCGARVSACRRPLRC